MRHIIVSSVFGHLYELFWLQILLLSQRLIYPIRFGIPSIFSTSANIFDMLSKFALITFSVLILCAWHCLNIY